MEKQRRLGEGWSGEEGGGGGVGGVQGVLIPAKLSHMAERA